MRCLLRRFGMVFLLLAIPFMALPVRGFTRCNFRELSGVPDRDLRVADGRIAFQIEEDGSFGITDGSDIDAIRAAFREISSVRSSVATVDDAGSFSLPTTVGARDGIAYDHRNSIYFFKTPDPSFPAIALTSLYYDVNSGLILDVDIAVNEADFAYSTSTPDSQDQSLGDRTFDIQEIVTHECMHAVGFGHSPVAGRFDPSTGCEVAGWYSHDFSLHATMFPWATGTISGRTLSEDDAAALSAVYPNGNQTGSIAGRIINGANCNPVKGAHVVAVRVADPDAPVVGTISGIAEASAAGDYTLAGLPPGDYFLRIEPLIGTTNPFTEQATPFSHFDTDFTPEFYSGPAESPADLSIGIGDATVIHVEAGSRITGAEFVTNTPVPAPTILSATYRHGKLKITGDCFLAGAMACEINGTRLGDVRNPRSSVSANRMATQIVSKDAQLEFMMGSQELLQVVVINTVTGDRSGPVVIRR